MGTKSKVDVVIVGAGAAGLAAGRRAGELGLSFLVFEAMDRIGGRAHTESTTFGVPWDRGCHWLHSADINPMRELADSYGFSYMRDQPPHRMCLGSGFLSDQEMVVAHEYVDAGWAAVLNAGAGDIDVPASTLIDRANPYYPVFRTTVAGEWSIGDDDLSTRDAFGYRDTDHNWPVREGYGAIVARRAADVPVELSTPVTRIQWGGNGVTVTTTAGEVQAHAVVVTVSTKIIQDGVIAFDPPLPDWKQDAYDSVQLGNANKVCFAIDGRELGVEGHSGMWVQVDDHQGMYFQLRPFGYDLANGFLAGELGAEAERLGSAAMIDVGLSALKRAFGSRIEQKITRSACTTWQTDPWIRGAYGAARPGMAHKRKDLGTPIDGKLFWAGEATSPEFYSTAHGADQTGVEAIEAVASLVTTKSR